MDSLSAILVGYLLGSIVPGYLFGKGLKNIDIRKYGTGHAGTTNVIRSVGILPAIPTAIYDTLKGISAILIARLVFGTSPIIADISGIAAISGHIFPFYIGFKGGQGAATATGILIFNLFRIFQVNKTILPVEDWTIIILLIIAVLFISRKEELVSVIILPFLSFFLIMRFFFDWYIIFNLIIAGFLFSVAIRNIIRFRMIKLDTSHHSDFTSWRTFIRPAAMAFPVLSFYLSRPALITLIGSVLGVFFIFDLVRLLNARVNRYLVQEIRDVFVLFKEGEAMRFSSMTLFLFGCFLSFLLFPGWIAFAAVTFLIFGDMAAVLTGMAYGRHRLFNKTWEGTLAYLITCIVAGYMIHLHLNVPLLLILAGGVIASFIEVLPLGVDDNLTTPVISGAIMSIGYHLF